MKTIEVDDQVYEDLSQRVQGFNESPNSVIKRLLKLPSGEPVLTNETETEVESPEASQPSELEVLLNSPEFRRLDGIGRYLHLLQFLHSSSPEAFEKLPAYRRKGAKRINFSNNPQEIRSSGSNTKPQQIPGTEFFVLSNLDNKSKRKILADIMPEFGFSWEEIKTVLKALPDSGIKRSSVDIANYYLSRLQSAS